MFDENKRLEIMEFPYEEYPDGISDELKNLTTDVWDRGYYLETNEGIWYEVYVNNEIKSNFPSIGSDFKNEDSLDYNFRGFISLIQGNYNDYNQITFFVFFGEEKWNLDEMTDIFY